jgi:cell division protein FtsI (penicillin-binding protein 3)
MSTTDLTRSAAHNPELPRPNRAVQFEGEAKRVLDQGRNRLLITAMVFAVGFAAVAGRLVDLAVVKAPDDEAVAGGSRLPTVADDFLPARASIADRHGNLVAASLPTASLYANPRDVLDAADAARQLVKALPDLDGAELSEKLTADKSFVWIRRNLTPRQQFEVNRLGIPGLYFQRDDKRIYPHGALLSHVVGFADVDGRGLAGIEQSLDLRLREDKRTVDLSIDLRLQHILKEELQRGMAEFSAIGGAGIVMDVRTGELLAMVSLPDFDPNRAGSAPADSRFNRNTLGVYEMGSTFKTLTLAMGLDSGVATMRSSYDAREPIKISRFTINDDHAQKRWLTVPEIYKHSSNIGSAKLALDVGVDGHRAFMARMGMLEPVKVELGELGKPKFPRPWRSINTITIAFGHGLSVTPLHLAMAASTIVNGGVLRQPTLLKRETPETTPGPQVLKPQTSDNMRRLMRLVVEEGTGRRANAPGYWVGGKTGTAEKVMRGGYRKNARLSSFVAAFPIYDPQYVLLVMIDEPKGNKQSQGYATGGWVAAPVVHRVVSRMGPLLGIRPVEDGLPEIRQALVIDSAGREKRLAAR